MLQRMMKHFSDMIVSNLPRETKDDGKLCGESKNVGT